MAVGHLSSRQAGRSNRKTSKAALSGLAAAASVFSIFTTAGLAHADIVPFCLVSGTVRSTAGAALDGPVTLSWHIEDRCRREKEILINGSPVGVSFRTAVAEGQLTVTPAITTKYVLTVRTHMPSGGTSMTSIGSETIVGGSIIEYRINSDGRLVVSYSSATEEGRKAKQVTQRVLRNLKEAYSNNLIGRRVIVNVIPAGSNLTDLPGYTHLAGVRTPDGRLWDDVDGAADTGTPKVAVSAESLLGNDISPVGEPYTPGYVLTHELGHLVMNHATGSDIRSFAEHVLATQLRSGGDFVGEDSYTSSNVDEYWAEGTAAHFSMAKSASMEGEYSQTWLSANNHNFWQLICNVYKGCSTS